MNLSFTLFFLNKITKKLQHQSYLVLLLLFLIICPTRAQRSFLGADGGLEGTATVVNILSSGPGAGSWTKSSSEVYITSDNATVRSGGTALKVNVTSISTSKVYGPSVAFSASTSFWQVQYYRRAASTTNTIQNQTLCYRGSSEQNNATYGSVSAANTWEKVTYAPSLSGGITSAAVGLMVQRRGTTGGDMYFDDFVIYESSTADNTAPASAGTVTAIAPTATTMNVGWVAATGGVDGGGYMVVRYAVSPNTDNDPNINGVYAVGNTTTNGTGSLTGTVCYVGTGTSFTDTALTPGVTYYYKVYTFDKAYNYAAESQSSGATPLPVITGFSPTTACLGSTLIITGTNLTGASSVTIGGTAASSFTVNSNTQITAVVGSGSSGSVRVTVGGSPATLTGFTFSTLPGTPTITAGGATTFCQGGSVVLTSSSATGYLWSNGETTQSITASASSSYTVRAQNAGGCLSAASVPMVVTMNPLPTTPTVGSNSAVCESSALNLTASYVPVTGFTMNSNSGISFIDISATGTSIGALANDSATTNTNTSYTYNCIAYTTATVSNNGVIVLGTASGLNSAANTVIPGSTSLAGMPFLAPFWDDLNINSGSASIKTQTNGTIFIIQYTAQNHTNYATGTITFQVQLNLVSGAVSFVYSDVAFGNATYDSGSSATIGIQMGGNSGLQYSLNSASLTNGQSITFTPNVAAYAWTGPNGFTASTQNPILASTTLAANGVYSVILKDTATNCQTTAVTTSVTVNPAYSVTPTITAGGTTTFCAGGSVVLTSSPATTYLWSTGATTQSISVTNSGNYTVQGGSGSGCMSVPSGPIAVTVLALPVATITPGPAASLCAGTNTTLTANTSSSYLWSTGATTQSISVSNVGNYTVSVTNANGCQSNVSSPTVVTAYALPATPTAGYNAPLCEGSAINLTASAVQIGGYTMNTNSGVSFVDISATGTTVGTISDESESNITIPAFTFNNIAYTTARVGNNGLIVFGSATGDIGYDNQALPSTINTAGNVFLAPYWDDLNVVTGPATIKTKTVGNIFIIQFTNQNQYDYPAGMITYQVQLNLVTGAIHFVYQDAVFGSAAYDNGITATIGIQMSGTSALQYSYNTASISSGASITFNPILATYNWSGPNGFTSSVQNPTIPAATAAANGVYSVTVIHPATGCQSIATTVNIALNPSLNTTPTITAGGPTTFCQGGNVVLTSSPASSYLWSTGATTQSITVSASGNYTVQAFTSFGCVSPISAPITITVNTLPITPTITAGGSTTICSGTNVTLTSSVGTSYLWSTGEMTQSITVSDTDSYTVQVNDAIGCRSAASLATNITVLTTPAAPTANAQSFCVSAKVSNLTATGTALKWYNVPTGGTALLSTASILTGTYYVSQTVNGCESARKSVAVTIYTTPPPTAASSQVFCNAGTVADLAATGTSLKWYFYSDESPSIPASIILSSGSTYYVTQTLNGCESTKIMVTATINVTPAPTGLSYQIYAGSATLADLSLTGTGIKWYAAATGGTALASTTSLGNGTTYYASQTLNNCEGIPRFSVTVKRISDPNQNFCGSATVANLVAAPLVNQVANWFSSAISTVVLPGVNALTTKTYYVEQAYPPLISTLAGSANGGTADGTGAAAQFNYPRGITTDANGTIYLSDTDNHRIRKITRAGVTTTIAGGTQGYTDGDGIYAKFNEPSGIVVDAAGYVYVSDTYNHCIRKISPYGTVTTFVGSTSGVSGTTNASGISARFYYPVGLVMDSAGNFYVVDSGNNRIRKITAAGVVTTFAGTTQGYGDATGTTARFNNPFALAIDSSDNLYVTDSSNYCIRKITPAGVVTTLAGSTVQGFVNGTGTAAQFYSPSGVAVDATGTVFVTDTNYSTDAYIRKITPAGVVTNYAGGAPGYAEGTVGVAKLQAPHAITGDAFGNLYVTEYTRIRAIRKDTYSNRVPVTVTINNPDGAAPTTTARTFCNVGYVSDLAATGIGTLQWYDVVTGGTALVPTTALSTGTYYVTQTLNGCESSRTAAVITVNVTTAPTGLTNQIYAGSGTLANLAITGTDIKWYAAATGGTVLPDTTPLVDTTVYYASQTLNACESANRLAINVKRISAVSQSFCGSAVAADLITTPAPEQMASWYSSAAGGTVLSTEPLSTGTYYVDQGPTASNRVAVNVTVNPLPLTPTITAGGPTTFCAGSHVTLTSSAGNSYLWSTGSTGQSTSIFASGTYTVKVIGANGCSSLLSAPIVITSNPLPTTPIATSNSPVCQGSTLSFTASNSGIGRYTMNSNSGVSFIDISGTGTSIGALLDDSETNITIPAFTYNGIAYTSARVSPNGIIVFGANSGEIEFVNGPLPGSVISAGNAFLAPYWDDLNVTSTPGPASIKTQTVGDNFIIQYTLHNHYTYEAGTITFQVQLNLVTKAIHFVYQDVIFGNSAYDNGVSASIGIQMNSINAVQYSYNSASLVNGQSITFTPITPMYLWTAPNTTTNSLQNPTLVGATPTANGVYTLVVTDPVTGCRSATAGTTVLVKATTPPTANPTQVFCPFVTVADLVATGNGAMSWFDVATGGMPLTSVTPLSTGTYYVSQILNDCESARVAVAVTINPITTSTTNASACESYTWPVNNQTYTQSGTYTVTGANVYGCLDTKTLVLTINGNTSATQNVTACGNYTWSAGSGITYNESGTYIYVNGCQTQTLVLTITPNTSSTTTITSCGPYYWLATAQTYAISGTYTYINGCETQILALTIVPGTTIISDITACNTFTWPVNNQTYTTSGTYNYVNGCRTEILNLNLACGFAVNLKLNIEGYYDAATHAMRPVLANQGIGNSTTNVDNITVELRNEMGGIVSTTTTMLHTDGTATASFGNAPGGSYYLAIKYRNAIETWSANPITIGQTAASYDFSNSASKAYGNNMKFLETGVYGFYTGDINQDGYIEGLDYDQLNIDTNDFAEGFNSTDLNGDGFVEGLDYDFININVAGFIESMHP
jgi:hypothetical protein